MEKEGSSIYSRNGKRMVGEEVCPFFAEERGPHIKKLKKKQREGGVSII